MLVMMVSLSASKSPQLSTSRPHKTFVVVGFLAALLALSGCGDRQDKQGTTNPGESVPRDLSGAIPSTSGGQPAARDQGNAPPQPQQPAAKQATDFAPVDVVLGADGFAKGTPRTIHVPSDFIIIVSVRSRAGKLKQLSVISPSTAQTFKVRPGDEQKVTLDAMRAGETAKLVVGNQTVKIAADADPGP